MTEDQVENLIETEGRELWRRLLQAHLDERGPGKVSEPVSDRNHREHTHQRLESWEIKSIFGEVTLDRQSYGGRGLENLRPLDAELNLPEKHYSHPRPRPHRDRRRPRIIRSSRGNNRGDEWGQDR
jgi:hypothetical protein